MSFFLDGNNSCSACDGLVGRKCCRASSASVETPVLPIETTVFVWENNCVNGWREFWCFLEGFWFNTFHNNINCSILHKKTMSFIKNTLFYRCQSIRGQPFNAKFAHNEIQRFLHCKQSVGKRATASGRGARVSWSTYATSARRVAHSKTQLAPRYDALHYLLARAENDRPAAAQRWPTLSTPFPPASATLWPWCVDGAARSDPACCCCRRRRHRC